MYRIGGIELFKCDMCGSEKEPDVGVYNENTDADGNRGIKVKTISCVECEHEFDIVLGY